MKKLLVSIYLLLLVGIFVYLRIPRLLAWWVELQSDHAIVGLMAKHITEGHFPVFFYGQSYMGSLIAITSATIAKLQSIFGYSESIAGIQLTVGPLSIAFASLFWAGLGIIAWFLAVAKKFNIQTAVILAPILAIGSVEIFKPSTMTNGSVAIFTLSAFLWFSTPNSSHWKNWEKFFFGSILGISWWTNQNIIFFFLPILIIVGLEHQFFSHPFIQYLLKLRKYFLPIYSICAILLIFGTYIALRGGPFEFHPLGIRIKISNGTSTIRDSIFICLGFHIVGALIYFFRQKKLSVWVKQSFAITKYFVIGFLLGYFPVWAGKIFAWYPKNYGLKTNLLPIKHWGEHFYRTIFDTLPGTLASHSIIVILISLPVVVRAIIYAKDTVYYKQIKILLLVILLNVFVTLISERALGTNYRYVYASFFAYWILFSFGISVLNPKIFRPAIPLVILFIFLYQLTPLVTAAKTQLVTQENRRTGIENILYLLKSNNTEYCWGDFWTTYLLTFLSNETIIFSPHQSAKDFQIRIPKDHKKVEMNNPDCYIYRKESHSTARLYFSREFPWK